MSNTRRNRNNPIISSLNICRLNKPYPFLKFKKTCTKNKKKQRKDKI